MPTETLLRVPKGALKSQRLLTAFLGPTDPVAVLAKKLPGVSFSAGRRFDAVKNHFGAVRELQRPYIVWGLGLLHL